MSSTIRGPQFGDLAPYVIMGQQSRKNKERNAQLAQQQAAFNACRMRSAKGPQFGDGAIAAIMMHHYLQRKQERERLAAQQATLSTYRPPIANNKPVIYSYPVYVPIYTPVYPRQLRFGGPPPVEISPEDIEEELLIGGVGLLGKGVAKALVAGEKRYKILERYEKMPTELETGKQQLATAKSSSNPVRYYHEAENSFLTAATKSTAHTHKAHGYRHAAIAAKLAGDNGAAKAHQTNAKKARKAAAGSDTWADGPKKDIEACYGATKFFVNQVAQPVKDMTAGIFVAACSTVWLSLFAIQKLFKPSTDIKKEFQALTTETYNDSRLIASPFEKARIKTANTLKLQFKALDGEDSDDEWIFRNSERKTKGVSTGRGLRHQYQ